VELHELHIDQRRARPVRQGMAVAGAFPAIARYPERFADAAGRKHNRLGVKDLEIAALAVVRYGAHDALPILEQLNDRRLHVDVNAEVDRAILQRSNHLQARAVAYVRQPRVLVAAEVALQDAAVLGTVEQRAPGLEFAGAVRGLLGVQLRHAAVVHILAAAHRIREVDPPVVAVVDVAERRRQAALGHHRVGLAEQRFAHQPHRNSRVASLDGGAQTGSSGAHNQDIVLELLVLGH
jgi:hypothetical protein